MSLSTLKRSLEEDECKCDRANKRIRSAEELLFPVQEQALEAAIFGHFTFEEVATMRLVCRYWRNYIDEHWFGVTVDLYVPFTRLHPYLDPFDENYIGDEQDRLE